MRQIGLVLLACIAGAAPAADNVDTAAMPKERVEHMKALVTTAVDQLDSNATAT